MGLTTGFTQDEIAKTNGGAKFYEIQVTRSISAKGTSRKKASELIAVWNNESYSKNQCFVYESLITHTDHI